MYCKLLVCVSYLFLEIKQCVLSPPGVSKPPPVVSPTNILSPSLNFSFFIVFTLDGKDTLKLINIYNFHMCKGEYHQIKTSLIKT